MSSIREIITPPGIARIAIITMISIVVAMLLRELFSYMIQGDNDLIVTLLASGLSTDATHLERALDALAKQSDLPMRVYIQHHVQRARPPLPMKTYPFDIYYRACGDVSCTSAIDRCKRACDHVVLPIDIDIPYNKYIHDVIARATTMSNPARIGYATVSRG